MGMKTNCSLSLSAPRASSFVEGFVKLRDRSPPSTAGGVGSSTASSSSAPPARVAPVLKEAFPPLKSNSKLSTGAAASRSSSVKGSVASTLARKDESTTKGEGKKREEKEKEEEVDALGSAGAGGKKKKKFVKADNLLNFSVSAGGSLNRSGEILK